MSGHNDKEITFVSLVYFGCGFFLFSSSVLNIIWDQEDGNCKHVSARNSMRCCGKLVHYT